MNPSTTGEGLRGTTFFPEVRLNFAENLLRHDGDSPAICGVSESREDTTITHSELRRQVAAIQQSLLRAGLQIGVEFSFYGSPWSL